VGSGDISLTPASSVSGQLIDPDGSTPQNGSIRLIYPGDIGYQHNRTTEAGEFHFRNKPAGDYVLFATTPAGQSDRVKITLKEGEQLAGLKIALRHGIDLTGRVSGLLPGERVQVARAC
jgi:hypothetical protein